MTLLLIYLINIKTNNVIINNIFPKTILWIWTPLFGSVLFYVIYCMTWCWSTRSYDQKTVSFPARRNHTLYIPRLHAVLGITVSFSTIRRKLHECGLRARRRFLYSTLNGNYWFAAEHGPSIDRLWPTAKWHNCLFTDKFKYTLYYSNCCF